jgi:hypothetical protein
MHTSAPKPNSDLNPLGNTDAGIVAALASVLNSEMNARRYFIQRRQRRIARVLGENRKSVDGLGAPTAEIDMESYIAWQRRYPGCWKDKQFVREFLRDNEACRVKAKGTRTQVGFGTGIEPVSARSSGRVVKRYG